MQKRAFDRIAKHDDFKFLKATKMATFWNQIGRQLRCPSGRGGRLAGLAMTFVNKKPNHLAVHALDIRPTDMVLELGFGPGAAIQIMAPLAAHGRVFGIDNSPEMLAQASRRNRRAIARGIVEFRQGSFTKLPWEDKTIDKILAVNVVYFFSQDASEIREMRRVLKPGGVVAIYATDKATMSHWKFAGEETHSLFDDATLLDLLLRGGFRSEEISVEKGVLPFGIKSLLAIATRSG